MTGPGAGAPGAFPERVPPLPPSERDDRQAALVDRAGAELGVYTTLVRSPDVFADFLTFGQRLLNKSTLDPRVRELLILRTAWRCRAAYIWAHHEVIGRGPPRSRLDQVNHPNLGPRLRAKT